MTYKLILLSNNKDKLAAANVIFKKYDIVAEGSNLEFPEIQADTSLEVARDMVLKAYKQLKRPIVREDHSFFLGNTGIPGPYMGFFDKRVDTTSLLTLLKAWGISEGHFELGAAYIDHAGKLNEFSYKVPVVFESSPRGDQSLRWERLMRFPEEDRVFAEYPSNERTAIWAKNYEKIARQISTLSKV